MGLKDLEESLSRTEKEIEIEELKRRERERKSRLEKKKALAHEAGLRDEKLKLAKEIFSWASEFVQTPVYKCLLGFALKYPHIEKSIYVFDDGWGHVVPHNDGHGCWSHVKLDRSVTFTYEAGYKWMGVSVSFSAKTPEGLAEKLNHAFLETFSSAIKSEKIYDIIKSHYAPEKKWNN